MLVKIFVRNAPPSLPEGALHMVTPFSEMSKRFVLVWMRKDENDKPELVFSGEQYDTKRKAINRWMKLTDEGSINPDNFFVVDRSQCIPDATGNNLGRGILTETAINYKRVLQAIQELEEGKRLEILESMKKLAAKKR